MDLPFVAIAPWGNGCAHASSPARPARGRPTRGAAAIDAGSGEGDNRRDERNRSTSSTRRCSGVRPVAASAATCRPSTIGSPARPPLASLDRGAARRRRRRGCGDAAVDRPAGQRRLPPAAAPGGDRSRSHRLGARPDRGRRSSIDAPGPRATRRRRSASRRSRIATRTSLPWLGSPVAAASAPVPRAWPSAMRATCTAASILSWRRAAAWRRISTSGESIASPASRSVSTPRCFARRRATRSGARAEACRPTRASSSTPAASLPRSTSTSSPTRSSASARPTCCSSSAPDRRRGQGARASSSSPSSRRPTNSRRCWRAPTPSSTPATRRPSACRCSRRWRAARPRSFATPKASASSRRWRRGDRRSRRDRRRLRRRDRVALRRRRRRARARGAAASRSERLGQRPAAPARPLPAPARRGRRRAGGARGERRRRGIAAMSSGDRAHGVHRPARRRAVDARAACVRTLAAIREVAGDAPVTILAVPRYHDEKPTDQFEAWLDGRARRGDELALHGCTHRDDGTPAGWLDKLRRSRYTRGEGEFWSLSRAESLARIDVGIEWFAPQALAARRLRPAGLAARPRGARSADPAAVRIHGDLAPARPPAGPDRGDRRAQSASSTARRARGGGAARSPGTPASPSPSAPILCCASRSLHPRDADFAAVESSWQGDPRARAPGAGSRRPSPSSCAARSRARRRPSGRRRRAAPRAG